MSNETYTVQYYLDKFRPIPDQLWCIGEFTQTGNPVAHCAYGHCGCTDQCQENEEANALERLFIHHGLKVDSVNDGDGSRYAGPWRDIPTPKGRILAALESFAELEKQS